MSALLFLVATASAWEVKTNSNGEELSWDKASIAYELDPYGDDDLDPLGVETAVTSAARAWDHVPGSDLALDYEGRTSLSDHDYEDDVNIVYFEDAWDQDPSLLAVTYVYSLTETGEIVGFDIAVNTDYPWSTTATADRYDLQNSMTHEFGHAVGLDHSSDGDATMFGSTSKGETDKRTLEIDDEQGARYLYGLPGWIEPATLACSSTSSRGAGTFLALLAALALMRRRAGSDSKVEPVES